MCPLSARNRWETTPQPNTSSLTAPNLGENQEVQSSSRLPSGHHSLVTLDFLQSFKSSFNHNMPKKGQKVLKCALHLPSRERYIGGGGSRE